MIKINKLREKVYGRVFHRNASLLKYVDLKGDQKREVTTESTQEKDTHTFILISKDNTTERYDFWEEKSFFEELDVNGADFSQLKTFFKDHNPSVENAIGKIENKRLKDGELLADVKFGTDLASQNVKLKYDEDILTDVSIGYRINEMIETKNNDSPNHILVTDFTIVELSAVWKGADSGAVKIKNYDMENNKRDSGLELYKRKQNLREKGFKK